MSVNISEVELLWKGLDRDYNHTLYFSTLNDQYSAFTNDRNRKFTDFTFITHESKIRLNIDYDTARKYKYLRYKNVNFGRTYYAFITGYEWKNDSVTEITIETDVIQTWMFAIKMEGCFVEREHTADDKIGSNTIPENLEVGDFIVNSSEVVEIGKLANNFLNIIVCVTSTPTGEFLGGKAVTGSYSGVFYYAFPYNEAGISKATDFINAYDISTKVDNNAIVSVFLAPSIFDIDPTDNYVLSGNTPYSQGFSITKPKEYNGYNIRNKKLLTYPYNYLLVSNNAGGSAVYHFEHFSKDTITFAIYGVLTPGCSIRMIPMNYKGILRNNEEGINLGKYPICNWASDEFTNWLTQNSVNIGVNTAVGVGQVIAGGVGALVSSFTGVGTAIGLGTAVGGVSKITDQLTQLHQMSFTPPQANGNLNSGDVTTAIGENVFTVYHMCCKPEYMAIIDSYFDMYGYKTNLVKIPESNHRKTWWYTKTIECVVKPKYLESEIVCDDILKIKECYNRGITFWRNYEDIGNYSLDNSIV